MGVATLTEQGDWHSRSCSFFLRSNEARQDARYFRQKSIEVRPLVPKGILSVRQTGISYYISVDDIVTFICTYFYNKGIVA